MYLLHLDTLTVCQNERIPLTKSCFTFGLTSRQINSCQMFSIGFRSGDSGGVFHHVKPFSSGRCLALVYVRQGKYCE